MPPPAPGPRDSLCDAKSAGDGPVVLRADAMGMCFGVRDALAALAALPDPRRVTIHGELVHNPEVLADLDRRGFHRSGEDDRPVPATPAVLVTAHGISQRERRRLQAAGRELIDTTCPLVQRAHDAAHRLQAEGRRVIVLGRAGHVEVRGIVEDLRDPIVIGTADEVRRWPESRLGVVCQTTTGEDVAAALLAAIRAANPQADVAFADTICSPTKARVAALAALLPCVDGLVVVGGHNSNNTGQLVRRGQAAGVSVHWVEHAGQLDATWVRARAVVGLTAGTSTLPATIDAVHAELLRLAGGGDTR